MSKNTVWVPYAVTQTTPTQPGQMRFTQEGWIEVYDGKRWISIGGTDDVYLDTKDGIIAQLIAVIKIITNEDSNTASKITDKAFKSKKLLKYTQGAQDLIINLRKGNEDEVKEILESFFALPDAMLSKLKGG